MNEHFDRLKATGRPGGEAMRSIVSVQALAVSLLSGFALSACGTGDGSTHHHGAWLEWS